MDAAKQPDAAKSQSHGCETVDELWSMNVLLIKPGSVLRAISFPVKNIILKRTQLQNLMTIPEQRNKSYL